MTDSARPPTAELGDDVTAEVAERGREELLTTCATMLPYAAGAAMLYLEPWTWSVEFAFGAAAFLLALIGAAVWQYGTQRGRHGQAEQLLAEYAVLHSVDPGVGRRAPADRTARGFVRGRLLGSLIPLGLVALPLAAGDWDRPAWAVPGAVLVVLALVVQLAAREREARAGRRWLADPPGPPRG